jgi:hypothetical protein
MHKDGLYAIGTEEQLSTFDIGFPPVPGTSLPSSSSKDLVVYTTSPKDQVCHETQRELLRYLVGEHIVLNPTFQTIDSGPSARPYQHKKLDVWSAIGCCILGALFMLWRRRIQTAPSAKDANDSSSGKKKKKAQKEKSLKATKTKELGENATRLLSNAKITHSFKSLFVSDHVLGYGSHGTVVFKGVHESRLVAVKRLLVDFYDIAHQEVKLLQESDHHPNVLRYFCQVFLTLYEAALTSHIDG